MRSAAVCAGGPTKVRVNHIKLPACNCYLNLYCRLVYGSRTIPTDNASTERLGEGRPVNSYRGSAHPDGRAVSLIGIIFSISHFGEALCCHARVPARITRGAFL